MEGTTRDQFNHVIDVAPIPSWRSRFARAGLRERHRTDAAEGVRAWARYARLRQRLVGITDYGATNNRFTGDIESVQLDIGEDSHDHLITAEERFNLAMARQ